MSSIDKLMSTARVMAITGWITTCLGGVTYLSNLAWRQYDNNHSKKGYNVPSNIFSEDIRTRKEIISQQVELSGLSIMMGGTALVLVASSIAIPIAMRDRKDNSYRVN